MKAFVRNRPGYRQKCVPILIVVFMVLLLPCITFADDLLYDVTFSTPPHTVGEPPALGADDAPRDKPTDILQGDPTVEREMGALTDQPCAFGNGTAGYDQLLFAVNTHWIGGFPYVYNAYHIEMDVLVVNLEVIFGSRLVICLDMPQCRTVDFCRDGKIYLDGYEEIADYEIGEPVFLEIDVILIGNTWTFSVDGTPVHTGRHGGDHLSAVRVVLPGESPDDLAALDNVLIEGMGEPTLLPCPWVPAWEPLDQYAYVGDPATFSVWAVGDLPLEYQWYENGDPIPGATGSSYTIPVTTAADDDKQFRVKVTNSYGSTWSRTARLGVGATRCCTDDPTADYETLHEIIHLAEEGELVAVEDGVYSGYDNRNLNFQGKSVVLFSRSGNPQNCIIDCEMWEHAFVFASVESTVIRGITIRHGVDGFGGAVYCGGASPAFINCVFTLSGAEYGGAIFIEEGGSPGFTACKFYRCLTTRWGAAVYCAGGSPSFQGCTFFANEAEHPTMGGVLHADSGVLNLTHCTLAANDTAGACVSLGGGWGTPVASLDHCIIAFNVGQAISCGDSADAYMNRCNVYGNAGGDWVGCIAGQGDVNSNMSADPLFCDIVSYDFHLRDDSPCAPQNDPPLGPVGAMPVGCYQPEDFTLQQEVTGVWQSDAQWGDFDGDGDLDLVTSGESEDGLVTRIYENYDGMLTWFGITYLPGVKNESSGNLAIGDYDGDGDLDLAIAGKLADESRIARIYENDGGWEILWDTRHVLTGVASAALAWGDYDNDGDLDLVVTGHDSTQYTSTLYRNDPLGLLTPDTTNCLVGVAAGSVDWGDYDGDGDMDLIITGTDGSQPRALYYKNDPPGTLTEDGAHGLTGVALSDVAAGDYDNDGDLDLTLTGNTGTARIARIYSNDGSGSFTVAHEISDIYRSSCAWGDYDNDGDLDAAFCGYDGTYLETKIYENTGAGFSETGFALPAVREGALAWADPDRDGDLDLFITGASWDHKYAHVYENIGVPPSTPPTPPANLAFSDTLGVELKWDAASDAETPATGLYYCVRVGTVPGGNDVVSGTYASPLMGNVGQSTNLTLRIPKGIYYWSVRAIDSGLMASPWAPEQTLVCSGVNGEPADRDELLRFSLESNVPNPFNPRTTIFYTIPGQGRVSLAVYDVTGRLVRNLVDHPQQAGRHAAEWNGKDGSGRNAASGVYFCRLEYGGRMDTMRMVLLK